MHNDQDSTILEPQHQLLPHQTLAQQRFYASERCESARSMLQLIIDSTDYETNSVRYAASSSFCERHLDYLSRYPNIKLSDYISNLKLMTKKRKAYKS